MFQIAYGHTDGYLVDFPVANTTDVFKSGEWVTLNLAGKVVKQTGALATNTASFQVYGAYPGRSDNRFLKAVTLVLSSDYVGLTDVVASTAFPIGAAVTVASGVLSPAAVGAVAVGYVIGVEGTCVKYTRVAPVKLA